VASEFLYLPGGSVNGFATFSGSPIDFSSEGQWLATKTFSFGFLLAYFQEAM
jgi:hypothetical protein